MLTVTVFRLQFLGLTDPETLLLFLQILILPSTTKNIKKNLDFYILLVLFEDTLKVLCHEVNTYLKGIVSRDEYFFEGVYL